METETQERLRPYEPIVPGEILRDELEERGWTQKDFAEIIGKPLQAISEIITGKKRITPETAVLFSSALGTSAEFWLNLETGYRLDRLSKTENSKTFVERKARLFERAPITEMIKKGWLDVGKRRGRWSDAYLTRVEAAFLQFYGLDKLEALEQDQTARFRKGKGFTFPQGVSCWIRKVTIEAEKEILKSAEESRNHSWSEVPDESFRSELAKLSLGRKPVDAVRLKLKEWGIHFVVVEHLSRTHIDGAALWVQNVPVIAMTLRHRRVDNFWFTLFHELAHVQKHLLSVNSQTPLPLIDEDIMLSPDDAMEREANALAEEWLIPSEHFNVFLKEAKGKFSLRLVRDFAQHLEVHPAIVVGRLQYRNLVPYSRFRNLLESVE